MPLLTEPTDVLAAYDRCRQAGVAMAAFCAENTATMEAILAAAEAMAEESGLGSLPITVAATGDYHFRDQLRNYSCSEDIVEGFLAFRDDLRRLARPGGPFPRVAAIAQLDHGQPEKDQAIFEMGIGFWGCVMFDASTMPLAENMRATRAFRERHAEHYVVEGIVDEVPEASITGGEGGLTDPRAAVRYHEETGVELMVVNLGTEHRAMGELHYHADLAREISGLTGRRLVLHGASSLPAAELGGLAGDGIVKVNIWTILERVGGAAVAADTIRRRGRIMPPAELAALAAELGLPLEQPGVKPELASLTDAHRRREVFFPAVREVVRRHLDSLGYGRLAG